MGILNGIFGKKLWETKEKIQASTESEFGKTRTMTKKTVTEKDSLGNTISKTTTTQETERD